MKTSIVKVGENTLTVTTNEGSGNIKSTLPRETCPSCGQTDCVYSCDGSQGADDFEEDLPERIQWNAAMDTIESLVLSHACAGVNVESKEYAEGIETTLEALVNNL